MNAQKVSKEIVACNIAGLPSGITYDCRFFKAMQEQGRIPKDASIRCVGMGNIDCPSFPNKYSAKNVYRF